MKVIRELISKGRSNIGPQVFTGKGKASEDTCSGEASTGKAKRPVISKLSNF